MEIAAATASALETTEKVGECVQAVDRVSDVSQSMKNVSESGGINKLSSSSDFSNPVDDVSQIDVSSSADAGLCKDVGSVFDEGIPAQDANSSGLEDAVVFDEGIPLGNTGGSTPGDVNVFDEGIPAGDDGLDLSESGELLTVSGETVDTVGNSVKGLPNPEQMDVNVSGASEVNPNSDLTDESRDVSKGLTDEQKQEIRDKTGWSDNIIDYIGSMEEAQVYMDAGLVEGTVNGKAALLQPNLDVNLKVGPNGETNGELMSRGYSPRMQDGQAIELHHIGQHPDSPLAELSMQQHRGKGNDAILHEKQKESEIDRASFSKERSDYWKERSNELNNTNNE